MLKKTMYNWWIRTSAELNYKYHDSYCISDIVKKKVYCLKLIKIMKKIHSVFHVSLLKFYHDEVFNTTSSVLSLKVNNIKKYEIKTVLNS